MDNTSFFNLMHVLPIHLNPVKHSSNFIPYSISRANYEKYFLLRNSFEHMSRNST